MSNPFDQFESDIHAALPPVGAPPPSLYGPPPPPMGQPPMMPHQPPPMQAPTSSGGSFYGAHGDNPYGAENQYAAQPPTYQQPVAAMDPFASYGAPPPQKQQQPQQQAPSSPGVGYTAQPPYGYESAPQQVPSAVYMNQPPEAASYADPWGGPPVEAAPPAQQPPAPPMSNMQALVPSQQHPSNPYGMPPNPYGTPNNYGAPEQQAYVAPPSMEQQQQQQQSYAVSPPEQNFSGGPPEQNAYGAPNLYGPPEPQPLNPYGMPSDPSASSMSALVPSHQPTNPYAPPAQAAFGAPVYGYGPPPPPPPVDPFSVFESQSRAPAPTTTSVALVVAGPDPTASDDDFWSSFGANAPAAAEEESEPPVETAPVALEAIAAKVEEEKKGEEGLPPGGEWYDARIFTPTLGVMFFKPQELTDSLFLNTDKEIVDALGDRPVVAFIVEGSSARSAGVELGHVLLKVNNVDVRSPKEASRLIKEGPRPLPLLFYIPGTDVVVAEGEHMVKYDTRETTAPNSAKDWKPKYVVIGGIIAQPWMMNMYRSKSEYDIAVIETQARRPVSVKVKQFSLQGARIQNDWQGPQMVKYKNKLHPWKYIVVLPVSRNPIKISAPNLSQLKPVHEGIRRVLLAQQRVGGRGGGGGGGRSAENYARDGRSERESQGGGQYDSPSRESHGGQQYDSPARSSHGGQYDSPARPSLSGGESYDRPQQYSQPQQQHGYAQQQAYGY